jgi:hypothetical protein
MKKSHLYIFLILTGLIILSCDKSDTGPIDSIPSDQIASAYYPGGLNSNFIYRQDTLQTGQSLFDSVGTRSSVFSNYAVSGGSENITQDNILNIRRTVINSTLNFRRTGAGIYFLIDSSGIDTLLSTLPDSLKELVEFQIDNEIIAFSTPLNSGKVWSAFKAIVKLTGISLSLTLIEIQADYEGEEEVFVEALNANRMSRKIKYDLILKIPDVTSTDIAAILNTTPTIYHATGWFVKDIGLVKLEGNSYLINSLGSGNFNLGDTTGIAREVLTEFNLQ